MLQKITKVPSRYYQLVLLNIGLIIALSKEMSLLAIISSLVFVALAVAPVAIALGLIAPPPHQIFHEQISKKLKEYHDRLSGYLSKWHELQQEQKMKMIIKLLLAVYVSYNFICPCIETFVFMNAAFAYFFMQEEVEWIQGMLCNICEGKCPIGH